MRARAVQAMGELFYRRGDEAVFEAIFADEPYRSMTEGANSGLALRRLHEYAASLYPLALSELRIANRYATILINPESDRAIGPEASLSVYAGIVNESLARAKADIARMKEAQHPENEHIADVYTLLGVVLGKLFVTGRVEEHDANAAFESALLYYARADARGRAGIDGMARFYYAQHLTRDMFEGAHDEDARAIIAPLSSESYQGSFLYAFLASEKGNVLGNRQSIRRLAALDPAFRQLLLSLGWEERNLPTAQ
jgi:hypothetical protein